MMPFQTDPTTAIIGGGIFAVAVLSYYAWPRYMRWCNTPWHVTETLLSQIRNPSPIGTDKWPLDERAGIETFDEHFDRALQLLDQHAAETAAREAEAVVAEAYRAMRGAS